MGKVLRCWHRLPCLSLRLSLLVLCAWAVYMISTGFIYPSVRPKTTFQPKLQHLHSRRQANRTFYLDDSEADLKQPFEYLVPKGGIIREKVQPADVIEQKIHYEEVSISSKSGSLLREDTTKNETMEGIHKHTSRKNRRLGSQKRSLAYGLRKKKYENSDISHHEQKDTINYLEQNSKLNRSTNGIYLHNADYPDSDPSGRKRQGRRKSELKYKLQQSAIDSYKSETHLRKVDSNIMNYGLTTSSSTRDQAFLAMHSYQRMSSISTGYYQSANQETTHPSHVSTASSQVKIILLWTPLYKGWNFLPEGPTAFSHCAESHCEVTSNRSLLKDSQAVIFHVRTMSLLDLPPFRLPHQKWIIFSLEPPPQSYFPGFHFMYGMFNWTMTYRYDSDIVVPYGRIVGGNVSNRNNKTEKEWEFLWKNKTRPVIWMVSHCHTYSEREHFVRQLQKFIDVDILGGCGSAVCLFNQTYKCLEAFSRRYKFFLAFENSICDDYVTEKFFRALRYDIVPVVLGGADYKGVAPPGSYINAGDFPSPKELADHLHHVSENLTLYRTYFKWKDYGYIVEDKPSQCSLCEKIHSLDFKATSMYPNIAKWWVEQSHCTKWTPK